MKRCPVCFLRRVIGAAADSLPEPELLVVLGAVKRIAGFDFEVRLRPPRETAAPRRLAQLARMVAVAVLVLAGAAAPAAAADEEPLICVPRVEAATLFSWAGERPVLLEKLRTLEQDLAVKDRIIATQQQLLELSDQVAAKERTLRELAEQERDVYHGRADRIEQEGEKRDRWLRCRAWGATGALAGAGVGSAFMGVGALPGAGVGAIVGCVAGFLGAP